MLQLGTTQVLQVIQIETFGVYLAEVPEPQPAQSSQTQSAQTNKTRPAQTSQMQSAQTNKTQPAQKSQTRSAGRERSKESGGKHLRGEASARTTEKVLLPRKQVPEDCRIGTRLAVFLYRDSEDRLIATTHTPRIQLHEVRRLFVRETGRIGAFLDMGLERDVLLPFAEQTRKVAEGEEVLCALYLDKSERLCVTMNVYEYLRTDSPYVRDDRVDGVVYEISGRFGAFVAVDDRYSALIPAKELYGGVHVGDRIEARVTEVKEDGKLTLSLQEKAYLQMDKDAARILERMTYYGGMLPFTDGASPELIRDELQMSKNAFKRAVGRLLKKGEVRITERTIERTGRSAQGGQSKRGERGAATAIRREEGRGHRAHRGGQTGGHENRTTRTGRRQ